MDQCTEFQTSYVSQPEATNKPSTTKQASDLEEQQNLSLLTTKAFRTTTLTLFRTPTFSIKLLKKMQWAECNTHFSQVTFFLSDFRHPTDSKNCPI